MDSFELAIENINLLEYIREHFTDEIVKKGTTHFISCPLNDGGDSDPSLAIYEDQNSFYCYHCGGEYYGNIFNFISKAKGITMYQVLQELDKLYPDLGLINASTQESYTKKNNFIKYLTEQSELYNKKLLSNDYAVYKNALIEHRKLSEDTLNKFGIGIKMMSGFPRLSIPQYDENNNVLAFVTRQLVGNDPRPRYHFSNVYIDKDTGELTQKTNPNAIKIWEKGSFLYNINKAYEEDTVIIVEGHLDVLAASQMGLNAVATGQKVISSQQAVLLGKFNEIIISPDKDAEDTIIKTYVILRSLYPSKVIKVFCQQDGSIKDFGDLNINGGTKDLVFANSVFSEEHLVKNYNYNEIVDILNMMNEPVGRSIAIELISKQYNINPILMDKAVDRSLNV